MNRKVWARPPLLAGLVPTEYLQRLPAVAVVTPDTSPSSHAQEAPEEATEKAEAEEAAPAPAVAPAQLSPTGAAARALGGSPPGTG